MYNYNSITISGKIATGTSTLSGNLQKILNWEYINIGEIQRQYHREHNIDEIKHGGTFRPDQNELDIEKMTLDILKTKKNIIFESWLAGFITKDLSSVLRVLLYCSNDAIRIDRIANRDNLTIKEAKKYLKKRESENIIKWTKLYGEHDFWDKSYFHIALDTYSSGPMETTGKVLDLLGYK